MYRCIVIDDESYAIDDLKNYIEAVPQLTLTASYTDPLEALKVISASDPVDLILLDVDMPTITGVELAKEIRNKTTRLVFTTAHSKYAYEAFKVHADDYLLKPFTLGEFLITVNKLFPEETKQENVLAKDDLFFVKGKGDTQKTAIKFAEVIAVESNLNYVIIHTIRRKLYVYMPLIEIAEVLTVYPDFVQFQRSFIVNIKYIDSYDGNAIKMTNRINITVGAYYRKSFKEFVSGKLIKKTGRKY